MVAQLLHRVSNIKAVLPGVSNPLINITAFQYFKFFVDPQSRTSILAKESLEETWVGVDENTAFHPLIENTNPFSLFSRIPELALPKIPYSLWCEKLNETPWLGTFERMECRSLFNYVGKFETVSFSWPLNGKFPIEILPQNLSSSESTPSSAPSETSSAISNDDWLNQSAFESHSPQTVSHQSQRTFLSYNSRIHPTNESSGGVSRGLMVLLNSEGLDNPHNLPFLVGQVVNRLMSDNNNEVVFRIHLYHCVRVCSSPIIIGTQPWEPSYSREGFKTVDVTPGMIRKSFIELVEGQFLPESARTIWMKKVHQTRNSSSNSSTRGSAIEFQGEVLENEEIGEEGGNDDEHNSEEEMLLSSDSSEEDTPFRQVTTERNSDRVLRSSMSERMNDPSSQLETSPFLDDSDEDEEEHEGWVTRIPVIALFPGRDGVFK
jgi:hypothetical protein